MRNRERALRSFLFEACSSLSNDKLKSIKTRVEYGGITDLHMWYRDELFRQHKDKDDDHVYNCDDFLTFIQSELLRLGYYLEQGEYGDMLVKLQEEEN